MCRKSGEFSHSHQNWSNICSYFPGLESEGGFFEPEREREEKLRGLEGFWERFRGRKLGNERGCGGFSNQWNQCSPNGPKFIEAILVVFVEGFLGFEV